MKVGQATLLGRVAPVDCKTSKLTGGFLARDEEASSVHSISLSNQSRDDQRKVSYP